MNTVSKFFRKIVGTIAAAFLFVGIAQAEPILQVDIVGGTYDATPGVEDVIAPGPVFTVLALCSPKGRDTTAVDSGGCTTNTTYQLSIALTPSTDIIGDYGFILVNTEQIDVTAEMIYGVPPLDTMLATSDVGDLETHSIFPTFFVVFDVAFILADTCGVNGYNVAPEVGETPTGPGDCDMALTNSFFDAFDIDATNLDAGFGLHFDFFDTALLTVQSNYNGDVDVPVGAGAFAPYSHDGSYRDVPEPGALGLLGIGLLGLGLARRRKLQVQGK